MRKNKKHQACGNILFVTFFFLLSAGVFFTPQAASEEAGAANLKLGSPAPDFHLTNVVTGEMVSRDDFKDKKALLVAIICRHCPYVQHVKAGLAQLGADYAGKNIALVAISANDPAAYPEDSPEKLKEMALVERFLFPVLFDETQAVAKAYAAAANQKSAVGCSIKWKG